MKLLNCAKKRGKVKIVTADEITDCDQLDGGFEMRMLNDEEIISRVTDIEGEINGDDYVSCSQEPNPMARRSEKEIKLTKYID